MFDPASDLEGAFVGVVILLFLASVALMFMRCLS
jgi:hypothetical protein